MRTNTLSTNFLRFPLTTICLLFISAVSAQDAAVREEVFAEADKLRAAAEAAETSLFAPKSHEEAMRYYADAEEKFERGRRLDNVNEDLAMAVQHFTTALETTELSKLTLENAIAARTSAEEAEAYREAQDPWDDAEETFGEAIAALEDGRLDRARELGAEAQELYTQARSESLGE